jgi:hypothetical protein
MRKRYEQRRKIYEWRRRDRGSARPFPQEPSFTGGEGEAGWGWRGVEAKTNFAQFSQAVVGLVDGKHRISTPGTVSICPSLITVI